MRSLPPTIAFCVSIVRVTVHVEVLGDMAAAVAKGPASASFCPGSQIVYVQYVRRTTAARRDPHKRIRILPKANPRRNHQQSDCRTWIKIRYVRTTMLWPANPEAEKRTVGTRGLSCNLPCSALCCTRFAGFARAGDTAEAMLWRQQILDTALAETLLAGRRKHSKEAFYESGIMRLLYLPQVSS